MDHLWWIYPWKIVIFHSYVSLPKGIQSFISHHHIHIAPGGSPDEFSGSTGGSTGGAMAGGGSSVGSLKEAFWVSWWWLHRLRKPSVFTEFLRSELCELWEFRCFRIFCPPFRTNLFFFMSQSMKFGFQNLEVIKRWSVGGSLQTQK